MQALSLAAFQEESSRHAMPKSSHVGFEAGGALEGAECRMEAKIYPKGWSQLTSLPGQVLAVGQQTADCGRRSLLQRNLDESPDTVHLPLRWPQPA